MKLSAGMLLGPYEVLALVGTGGMGEVYKARDTRLGRTVAVKVSKEHFSERFEREARAIAALNHPHICHLYDVGPNYLVMEFVDGAPFGPTENASRLLDAAVQIADGLAAAHEAGVVHRDLKPGNLMVTSGGQVKILDFGLAAFQVPARDLNSTPTLPASGYGLMIGTAPYMSPEQARGEVVDARSDLWSLGVVLYEAATGVRPFDGPTDAAVFEALLGRNPVPVRERNRNVPVELERIISRLLEKDRTLRYQSAADLAADLRRVQRGRDSGMGEAVRGQGVESRSDRNAVRTGRWRPVLLYGGGVATALLALVAWRSGIVDLRRPPPVPSPSEFVQLTNFTESAVAPSLSPDGRMVTFIRGGESFRSRGQIYVKLLPSGESVRLTNDNDLKYGPVFTPDGSRVAYTRISSSNSWDTWTVPVSGGEPSRLLPNASGLNWMNDGRLLFSEIRGTGLHMGIVTATEARGGQRDLYFPAHERAMAHFSYPSLDRQWVLMSEMDGAGVWQPCRLLPFDGRSPGRQVGPPGACRFAAWSPDGRWMYFSAQVGGATQLFRQQFPDGSPEQLTFGPTEAEGVAVAPDGLSLITSIGLRQSAIWIHEAGRDRALSSEGFASLPRLSRDGRRVYYLLRENAGSVSSELRSTEVDSGRTERVLPGVSSSWFEVSPDEREVVFTTLESNVSQIWLAPVDRRTPPRLITQGDQPSFGADGELIFRMLGEKTNSLFRIGKDGSGLKRIGSVDVNNKFAVAPGGEWVTVAAPGTGSDAVGETVAVSVRDGASRKICTGFCQSGWTADGQAFYVVNEGSAQQTLVLPIPPGQSLPDLPTSGVGPPTTWAQLPGSWNIPQSTASPSSDRSSYVFTRPDLQRNLFRIPLR